MAKLATRQSEQWGCHRVDFDLPGGRGFVILPPRPARKSSRPWVWYAPSFIDSPSPLPKDLHRWYMDRWLAAGIAIAGVDVGESWGSPAGREAFSRFHELAVAEFSLDAQACLMAQSRGGLFHYNWAVEHPAVVRCIGAIYPVCNVTQADRVPRISQAYGLTSEQLAGQLALHNPVDRLAPLAEAKVPIFHVHGDADTVVPIGEHSGALIDRYRRLGGPGELRVIPGKGHEEVREYFQCPAFLEFMQAQALGS